MKRICVRTLVCAIVLAVGASPSNSVLALDVQISDDDKVVVRALESAHRKWLREVSFVCTYQYIQKRAKSISAALSGMGEQVPDSIRTGVFNKALGFLRHSSDWQTPPQVTKHSDGKTEVRRADFDEVSNDEILATVTPDRGFVDRAQLWIESRDGSSSGRAGIAGKYDAGRFSSRMMSPLNFNGYEGEDYFSLTGRAQDAVRRVTENSANSIEVETVYRIESTKVNETVEYMLTHGVPVVSRVTRTMSSMNGKPVFEMVAEGSNWVECEGGPVATVIRSVSRNPDPKFPEMLYLVQEWKSDDLGKRTPVLEDFMLNVPEDTLIYGVKSSERVLIDGKLDLTKIDSHGLIDGPSDTTLAALGVTVPATESVSEKNSFFPLIVAANLVLILAVAGWLLLRRTNQVNAK